jgi:hypothetical protein
MTLAGVMEVPETGEMNSSGIADTANKGSGAPWAI